MRDVLRGFIGNKRKTSIALSLALVVLVGAAALQLKNHFLADTIPSQISNTATLFYDDAGVAKSVNSNNVLTSITVLSTTGLFSGRITSGGVALAGVSITISQGGVVKATLTSASDGGYSASNLLPGAYDLKAEKTGYDTQTKTAQIIVAGQTTTVDLVLTKSAPSAGAFSGNVISGGTPLYGATITISQSGLIKATTTSSANGTFSFSSLAPGNYDIKVEATGYVSQTRTGEAIVAGQTTTENFALQKSLIGLGMISGKITNSAGTPLTGVKMTLSLAGMTLKSVTTDSSGSYSFLSLSQGSYALQTQLKSYRSQQTTVTVSSGQTATANIILSKTGNRR